MLNVDRHTPIVSSAMSTEQTKNTYKSKVRELCIYPTYCALICLRIGVSEKERKQQQEKKLSMGKWHVRHKTAYQSGPFKIYL